MIYLSITIDTEDLNTPFWRGDYSTSIIRHKLTVQLLNQIFKEFDVRATYFTSIFQEWYFKNGEVQRLIEELITLKHDVQLHTHPIWIDEQRREHMWMFSYEEQVELLRKGTEFIQKYTGNMPIAHRAGAYGLNQDTLNALKLMKIPVDSSMYFGHSNCKVQWTKNAVLEKEGLVIYPITCFKRVTKMLGIPVKHKVAKTDIDSCSLAELKMMVNKVRRHDLKVYDFFMHSYSLLDMNVSGNRFVVNEKQVQKLRSFLSYIVEQKDIQVITISDFYKKYQDNKGLFTSVDAMPSLVRHISPIEGIRKMK